MTDRIPLSVPDLRGNEAAYLANCVRDNWVSSAGPYVVDLEKAFCELTGREAAIACVNGSAALHLALLAGGVKPGDGVIVPDWTFAATANAVIHAGGEPVFVDIRRDDWTIDPDSIRRALERHGDKVRAIVAVDVLGNLPDPEPLRALAREHGLFLLEDAAGAIGAARDGICAGAIGDVAIFSLNGNKLVTAGGGGMIVLDDPEKAAFLRHFTTQARVGSDYRHDAVGFNYRLTNVNAAIGLAQLERIDAMLQDKRRIARRYRDAIAGRTDIAFMPVSRPAESSFWLCNVTVADEATMRHLVKTLNDGGIDARPFWCSLSQQPPYASYPAEDVAVSRELTDRVVTLPCSSHLTEDEQGRVLSALAQWRGAAFRKGCAE